MLGAEELLVWTYNENGGTEFLREVCCESQEVKDYEGDIKKDDDFKEDINIMEIRGWRRLTVNRTK